MLLKSKNGINFLVDSKMELLFAIHSAFHRLISSEGCIWIESPNISYVNKAIELINIENQPKLCRYITEAWSSKDIIPRIATVFDDNFNLCEEKITERIRESFNYGDIYDFAKLIKSLANKINWNIFLETQKEFYMELLNKVVQFPENLDINDVVEFYGYSKSSYNYVITVLTNVAFGIEDIDENVYCIHGFDYDEETKEFHIFYRLLENLFHEYSHPYVNPLIDNFFYKFTNINSFHEEAIKHDLPKYYSNKKETLLYEYFVRANAIVLSSKYTGVTQILPSIQKKGFTYLQELANYIITNKRQDTKYEDFFYNELIDYFNTLPEKNIMINKQKNIEQPKKM